MFWAYSCPSSGATTTAVAASGLPSELGDSSAVGRGRARRPDHEQQHCYHHIWFVDSVERPQKVNNVDLQACTEESVGLSVCSYTNPVLYLRGLRTETLLK